MDGGAEDQGGEEDGDAEGRVGLFDVFPHGLVGFFLGDAVGDVRMLSFLRIFNCELLGSLVDGLLLPEGG